MNRRDRRSMSKRLGIAEYQRQLPRNKKFELMRENIISGKKLHNEFVEKSRVMQEQYSDEADSVKLYNTASDIAAREGVPIIDAFQKAKIQLIEESKTEVK